MNVQEILETAYRFGWLDKAGYKEYRPAAFVLTIFNEYHVYDEAFNQQLIMQYTAGYNECPPDWAPRS